VHHSTSGVCVSQRFVCNWITDNAERDFARIFRLIDNKSDVPQTDDPFTSQNHTQR